MVNTLYIEETEATAILMVVSLCSVCQERCWLESSLAGYNHWWRNFLNRSVAFVWVSEPQTLFSGLDSYRRGQEEKSREHQQPLHIAFIDLTKAFDFADGQLIFVALEKARCLHTLLALVRSVQDNMKGKFQYHRVISNYFSISRGVKQQCVSAPILFVMCFLFVLASAYQFLAVSAEISLLSR